MNIENHYKIVLLLFLFLVESCEGMEIDVSVKQEKGFINSFCLLNDICSRYYDDFVYRDDDYSYTNVLAYVNASVGYKKEWPAPVKLCFNKITDGRLDISSDSDFLDFYSFTIPNGSNCFDVYNLIPGKRYYFRVISNGAVISNNQFNTTGKRRFVRLADSDVNVPNVRDLGGQIGEDGKIIKYGLLYRGGQFNDEWTITEENKKVVRDVLGVKAEIDFRQESEANTYLYSELGKDVLYFNNGYRIKAYVHGLIETQLEIKNCFLVILDCLKDNVPLYFHCTYGADRTGTLAFLIEGLCGVSENEICKDFELTCFSVKAGDPHRTRVDYQNNAFLYASMVDYLKTNYSGDSLASCINNYLLSIGLSVSQLSEIRDLLLESI